MVLVENWLFLPVCISGNIVQENVFYDILGNLGQENVFYDILEGKNAFLGYKKKKFKNSKN